MSEPFISNGIVPGQILADKYRVEHTIGEGGMGMVIAARHLELDERVAVKFLLPHSLSDAHAVARFAREARASVKIKSEHVARTLDVGRLENGAPYMVMEYLAGMDLAARLHQKGPLSAHEAVSFALQTCEALADAHALGIIHRDLKPANLFVTRRTDGSECVKVLDFGISKITSPTMAGPHMTSTTALMGSPLYMSPEQMASARNVDARSDIWALGVTLYEVLAGVPPFTAETITELCAKVLTAPTPSVRAARPDLPEGLDAIIGRCLERNPAARYSNVADFAFALAEFGPPGSQQSAERASRVLAAAGLSSGMPAVPKDAPSMPPRSEPCSTTVSWGQTQAQTPRGRGAARPLLILGALGVLATGGLAAGLLVRVSTRPPTAPSAPTFVSPVLSALPAGAQVSISPSRFASAQPAAEPTVGPAPPDPSPPSSGRYSPPRARAVSGAPQTVTSLAVAPDRKPAAAGDPQPAPAAPAPPPATPPPKRNVLDIGIK